MTGCLRKAIDLKCKECIYDSGSLGSGTWLQQVQSCTSPGCPLFGVRPKPKVDRDRSEMPRNGRFSSARSRGTGVGYGVVPGGCSDQPKTGLLGLPNGASGQILAACEVTAHG